MTRDPAQWQHLQALIDQALELEGAARADWLQRLDAAAPTDGAAVRDFLQRAEAAAQAPQLEPPAWLSGAQRASDRSGGEVAGYRLLAEIGRGGMGSVWKAAALADPSQGVAIKFPEIRASRDAVLARFARERDLLARLDHPGIARLLDAGLADDGEPFLILEYVDGVALDQWCQQQSADLAQRMRLVEAVADAVQAAHAQLVVHRDLKPANVLVDGNGRAVVLDFGIARLIEDEGAGAGSVTRLHGGAMTPAYAAPEQLQGAPPSVAMDVYALGLIAYELVEGRRAFTATDTPRDPPPRARRADADLATIIAKAMRAEPRERYPSAREFAEDLAAWRENRPIRARAPSLTYRARKFVRRHRGGVAAGMVALLAVIGGVIGVAWQAQVARAEAERARAEAARANTYVEILLRVFADPEAAGDNEQSGRMLLRGAELLRGLSEHGAPDAVADVMGRWASMMPTRSLPDEAIALYRDAEQLAQEATLRQRLQCRRLGVLLALQQHRDEALALLEQVQAALRTRPGAAEFAECHRVEANYWRERRDFDQALAALARADAAYRSLPEFEAGNRLLVRHSRGLILLRLNRVDEAERELLGALADIEAQGRGGDTLAYEVLFELSSVARRRSDFGAGIDYLERAIALRAPRGDADPFIHAARARLGNLLAWVGRTDEARALLVEAELNSRKIENSNAWLESAQLLSRWAIVWGDDALAQSLIDRQLTRFTTNGTSEHRASQYASYLQAMLDGHRGEFASAEAGIVAAVARFRAEGEGGRSHLPRALGELARIRLDRGDLEGAEQAAREALDLGAPAYEAAEWRLLLADSLAASDPEASARERRAARDTQCRIFGSEDARCHDG